MKKKEYSEREYWKKYWEGKVLKPTKNVFFKEYLNIFPKKGKLLDIGGFPGNFASYFINKFNYDVTILDYYIDKELVNKVEKINNLNNGKIKLINNNIFDSLAIEKFDIVTSFGFIEHFEDTYETINLHKKYLKEKGLLFLTIPNFTGINGLVQKIYDKENYKIHNIKSMNLKLLYSIMFKLGFKNIKVEYFGNSGLWIEPTAPVSPFTRKILMKLSRFIVKFPYRKPNKVTSSFILISGKLT